MPQLTQAPRIDFITPGSTSATGHLVEALRNPQFRPEFYRPMISDDERDQNKYICLNEQRADGSIEDHWQVVGKKGLTYNAYGPDLGISTLRIREWIQLDQAVLKAARPRLKLVNHIRSRDLEYTIPNGMGRTVLQYQATTAPGKATISMDGLRRSLADRPLYNLVSLPLPIIHMDFGFSAREIMTSRNNNTPLDTTMATDASIRVAELVEQLSLGTGGTFTYGGGTVYGLTNWPTRQTYSIASPTSSGWTPFQTFQDVEAMCQLSRNDFHYGPWTLFTSQEFRQYLDQDYNLAYPNQTLRERLMKIEGIEDVISLDFLTGYQLILVQMMETTFREVIGMDMTTLQWPGEAGMEVNFKVMCIIIPQPRADYYGNNGIVHGS